MEINFNSYDVIHSSITGKDYKPKDVVRLLNLQQIIHYLRKNVCLYDVYPSIDYDTGRDILCFVFDKKGSRKAYEEWLERGRKMKEDATDEQDLS